MGVRGACGADSESARLHHRRHRSRADHPAARRRRAGARPAESLRAPRRGGGHHPGRQHAAPQVPVPRLDVRQRRALPAGGGRGRRRLHGRLPGSQPRPAAGGAAGGIPWLLLRQPERRRDAAARLPRQRRGVHRLLGRPVAGRARSRARRRQLHLRRQLEDGVRELPRHLPRQDPARELRHHGHEPGQARWPRRQPVGGPEQLHQRRRAGVLLHLPARPRRHVAARRRQARGPAVLRHVAADGRAPRRGQGRHDGQRPRGRHLPEHPAGRKRHFPDAVAAPGVGGQDRGVCVLSRAQGRARGGARAAHPPVRGFLQRYRRRHPGRHGDLRALPVG